MGKKQNTIEIIEEPKVEEVKVEPEVVKPVPKKKEYASALEAAKAYVNGEVRMDELKDKFNLEDIKAFANFYRNSK